MGTRGMIGIKNADGTIDAIYCHWDSYPSHNGRILSEHYRDEGKVRELIALGDISSLREEIGEKHPFDDYNLPDTVKERWKNWCTAYGRDRGETGIEARNYHNETFFAGGADSCGAEYAYLFDNGEWSVTGIGIPRKPTFSKLEAVLQDQD
jgi:hypothetical protein